MLCGQSLGDQEVVIQVTSWLNALDLREGSWENEKPFQKYYEIKDVAVVDRLIKEKEAKVICQITAQSLRQYKAGSVTDDSFSRIVGPGGAQVGESRVFKLIFDFEKYEKGWVLSGLSKRVEENPVISRNIAEVPRTSGESKENLVMAGTIEKKVFDAKEAVKAVVDAKGKIYARNELAKLNSDLTFIISQIENRSRQNARIDFISKLGAIITNAEEVKASIPNRITEARDAAAGVISDARDACVRANSLFKNSTGSGIRQSDLDAMKADLAGLEVAMKASKEMHDNGDFFGAKDRAEAIQKKANAIIEQLTSLKRW